jgi:MFS family permease
MGRTNILLASCVIFFVAYLGFARTVSVVGIAVLFVYYGLLQGIFRSVGKALASDFAPELLRASAVGWYSAVVGLLELVASVVAGLLWDHISHAAVFYYAAIFAIAGSVGLLFAPGKRNRSGGYA